MGLTERHWFENEDVPENYEWALEDAVYNSRTNIKDTNPDHYRVDGADFIEYMRDPKISGFGQWMFANGYNTGSLEEQMKQKVRELTIDEWREWKANPKRDPICKLWEGDTSPMWILKPTDVHEPALLMGKLKLFTGKPSFEQCKEAKWK